MSQCTENQNLDKKIEATIPFCKFCGNMSKVPCKGCEDKFAQAQKNSAQMSEKTAQCQKGDCACKK